MGEKASRSVRPWVYGESGKQGCSTKISRSSMVREQVSRRARVNNCGALWPEALSANTSVLTCLTNELGYRHLYSQQLKAKAPPADVLIVLSGSGNSPNVVKALETGNAIGMKTFANIAYTGVRRKETVQYPITSRLTTCRSPKTCNWSSVIFACNGSVPIQSTKEHKYEQVQYRALVNS